MSRVGKEFQVRATFVVRAFDVSHARAYAFDLLDEAQRVERVIDLTLEHPIKGEQDCRDAMDELTAESQRLGLYDEPKREQP